MTSIPSSPIDALRSLLPMLGRDGGLGNLPAPGDALAEGAELEDGRPLRPPGIDQRQAGDARLDVSNGYMRGEGAPPLSHADAGRLADTLSAAMRHNPSHPLFRELQQLPQDTLRQLVQFVTQHASLARELPGQATESTAHAAARAASDIRNAGHPAPTEARNVAEAARSLAQAQQAAPERASTAAREALASSSGRAGEDVRATAMANTFEARAPAESRPASALPMAALLARADGVLSAVPMASAQEATPASPAPPGHAATSTASVASALQELAAQQALQARAPGETMLPARAEGAVADSGSSSGLPGLGGAAGVTLAVVGNPAGTTHANAPQAALRARKPDEARQDRRERVGEAPREDAEGEESRDGRRGNGESEARRPPGEARAANGDRPGAPAPAAAQDGAVTAAGHTAAAGLMLPRYDGTDADDARPAGHVDDGEPEDAEARQSRRQQWLYWSLIAVTYGCLTLALAMVAPDLFSLPFAPENATAWRNGLTATGLATGLWAWLLARRMR